MKRSEIDRLIDEAIDMLKAHHYMLPPFAFWQPEEWAAKGSEYDEIRDNMLGWDLTDFGSGNFYQEGLFLFTVRNGNLNMPQYTKPYAEKVLIVRENQITPFHFHWKKMEDILVRGGGNLLVQLYNRTEDEKLNEIDDVTVMVDGVRKTLKAGSILRLTPGESVTLPQGMYHSFWAENDTGAALVGEVSMTNDDNIDNRFLKQQGRFPTIEEDAPKRHLLCIDYHSAG